jgi:hypothetical protein
MFRAKHMICCLVCAAAVSANQAAAEDCQSLQASGDGTPADYRRNECLGNEEATQGKWALAEKHYRAALGVRLLEAPNYRMRQWNPMAN